MDEEEKTPMSPQSKFRILGVLLGIVMVFAAGEGFYSWSLTQRIEQVENAMQTQISGQDESIQGLQDQLGMHEKTFSDLQGDLAAAKTSVSSTQGEIQKAKKMTDELAKKQKESAEQLNSQLGQLQQDQESTKGSVGSLSSDVTGVKQEVTATKQDLASTRSDLQRTMGDLGVQSGLIATNRQELEELKQRGERIYVEFDLRKTNQPQKYADASVALQLKKTDLKRQKYTINLISDDRTIEKKDKNTNEPVQFYQQGYRIPSEIVVNQISKDRIVGYISVPKARVAAQMSGTGNTSQLTQSGS
jgi:chromosome segregation ATPase